MNTASASSNQMSNMNGVGGGANPGKSASLEQKSFHFPKLTEFKSATNNIYLATRPVMDPRQESEFNQQAFECKYKKTGSSTMHEDS